MVLFNISKKRKEAKAARKRISSSEFHGHDDYFYLEIESNEKKSTLEYFRTLKKTKDALYAQCNRRTEEGITIVTVKVLTRQHLRQMSLGVRRPSLSFGKITKEVSALLKLRHNNIVELLEVIDDPEYDKIFLVFAQMDLPTIAEINENSYLNPNEYTILVPDEVKGKRDLNVYPEWRAKYYFQHLISGLSYLHSKGITHKDIKPSNLIIDIESDILKLCNISLTNQYFTSNDDSDDVFGTPSFMCPQKCASLTKEDAPFEIDDIKSDIWSIGVLLYLLVVGRLPFRGIGCGAEYLCTMYHSIQRDEPEIPSRLSVDLQSLLYQLLQKRPDRRISLHEIANHPWLNSRNEDAASSSTDDILTTDKAAISINVEPFVKKKSNSIKGGFAKIFRNAGDGKPPLTPKSSTKPILIRKRSKSLIISTVNFEEPCNLSLSAPSITGKNCLNNNDLY